MSELPPTHPPTHTHTHTPTTTTTLCIWSKICKIKTLASTCPGPLPRQRHLLGDELIGVAIKGRENKPPEQDLVREPPSPHTPTLFQTISTAPSCTNGPDRQQRFAAQRQWNVFSGGRVSNKRLWSRTTAKSSVTFRLLLHRIWIISLHCKTKYCCPEGSRKLFLNNVEKVKI